MKKIPSFTIDHLHLLRGIYVSRKDYIGNNVVTTFDIRMKEPNREPAIGYGALHTIEHLAATYLMKETFRFIRDYKGAVPGAAPQDCGNYLLHDLPMARYEADKYLREVLEVITEKNLHYPTQQPEQI